MYWLSTSHTVLYAACVSLLRQMCAADGEILPEQRLNSCEVIASPAPATWEMLRLAGCREQPGVRTELHTHQHTHSLYVKEVCDHRSEL